MKLTRRIVLLALCLGCSSEGPTTRLSGHALPPPDAKISPQVTSSTVVPPPSPPTAPQATRPSRSAGGAIAVGGAMAVLPEGGTGGRAVGTGGAGGAGASAVGGTSAVGAASCAGSAYAVCADFETGKLPDGWTLHIDPGETAKVEMAKAAHGKFGLHFSGLSKGKSVKLERSALGGITNALWGRFYIYMSPGAPVGHTAFFNAFDQTRNWYAVGAESNSYFANWHPPSCCPEKYMRSNVVIPGDKWACYEFQFDGAHSAVAKVWADGQLVNFNDVSDRAGPAMVEKFTSVELGVMPYHSLSLSSYDGDDPPLVTDVYMDDVALDTQRIGCLPGR